MIEFFKNIPDFWSDSFVDFEFPHKVSTGQQDHFHPNYFLPGAELLQAFGNEVPCKEKFMKTVGAEQGSISLICLEPSKVIPIHRDTFYKLRQEFNVEIERCLRYLIFLEDWTFGQIVEFESRIITEWKSGDIWCFDTTYLHYAANSSHKNFITCQVNTFT